MRNHPPEIILESVRPRGAVLFQGTSCGPVRVRAQIRDRDRDPIRYRFITDIQIENQERLIQEANRPSGAATHEITQRIFRGDFVLEMQSEFPHTVSLVVTDAPTFSSTVATALAEVDTDPDSDGDEDYGVTEHRWVFFYREGEGCLND